MFHSLQKLIILAAAVALCAQAASAQVNWKTRAHVCDSNVPQEKALLDAVRSEDSALVGRLLGRGANPDAKNDCGDSAIHFAAQSSSTEILRQLIAHKADVNPMDRSFGRTPLMWVLDRSEQGGSDNTYEMVKLLVGAGADVNRKGKYADPPLTTAVMKQLENVVELLLAAGADVNAEDDGQTAYTYAAASGNKKLKSLLLAAGADPRVGVDEYKREYGTSALAVAASAGRTDVIEALLAEGIDPDMTNPGEVTALMRVTNDSSLDALLAAGADVNRRDNAGFTALMWAAHFGRVEHVKKLIALGADVNAATDTGATALDMAQPEVRDLLVQASARRGRNLLERLAFGTN